MTDFAYYKDLPYAVVAHGVVQARFRTWRDAEGFLDSLHISGFVIDTTPKPRVPEDAKFITWRDSNAGLHVAGYWGGQSRKWAEVGTFIALRLEDLPGVTPDTVFTVLDERSNT